MHCGHTMHLANVLRSRTSVYFTYSLSTLACPARNEQSAFHVKCIVGDVYKLVRRSVLLYCLMAVISGKKQRINCASPGHIAANVRNRMFYFSTKKEEKNVLQVADSLRAIRPSLAATPDPLLVHNFLVHRSLQFTASAFFLSLYFVSFHFVRRPLARTRFPLSLGRRACVPICTESRRLLERLSI